MQGAKGIRDNGKSDFLHNGRLISRYDYPIGVGKYSRRCIKRPVKTEIDKGWKKVDMRGNERIRFMKPTNRHPNACWRPRNEKNEFLDEDGIFIGIQDFNGKEEFRDKSHIPYTGGEKKLRGFD